MTSPAAHFLVIPCDYLILSLSCDKAVTVCDLFLSRYPRCLSPRVDRLRSVVEWNWNTNLTCSQSPIPIPTTAMSGPMSFYDTLFLRFPEDAIHELEQLHCAKASQRFELAAAIRRALQTDKDKDTDIDKQIYEEKMGRLTRLSLHECLLRIALDPEIYPVTYSWDSEVRSTAIELSGHM